MAGTKLDGAGAAKMSTLDDALLQLQHVHGQVERMAIMVRNMQPAGILANQIRRSAAPLVGQLKGQFGMIADQATALILAAGRGGSEQTKLRSLREHVAQIRTQIEITQSKVKEQHTVTVGVETPD